jgi:pilus assembly protein CpaF
VDVPQSLAAKPATELLDLMLRIHDQFVSDVSKLDTMRIADLPPSAIRDAIRTAADSACRSVCVREHVTPGVSEREWLVESVIDEAFGLGPLEGLQREPAITAILIRAPREVLAERAGGVHQTVVVFRDEEHINRILERIGRKDCVTRSGGAGEAVIRLDVQRLREAVAQNGDLLATPGIGR